MKRVPATLVKTWLFLIKSKDPVYHHKIKKNYRIQCDVRIWREIYSIAYIFDILHSGQAISADKCGFMHFAALLFR